MWTTLIYYGTDKAYRCRIDNALFPFADYGGQRGANKAANEHTTQLLLQQTADGVSVRAGLKERRRYARNLP